MPKIKWNANILLYNDKVFELVFLFVEVRGRGEKDELNSHDGQVGMVEKVNWFDVFCDEYYENAWQKSTKHNKNMEWMMSFLFYTITVKEKMKWNERTNEQSIKKIWDKIARNYQRDVASKLAIYKYLYMYVYIFIFLFFGYENKLM